MFTPGQEHMDTRLVASEPDAALVRAVRGGSLEALGCLYDRYAESMYATACRFSRTYADAEDVVHDVFVGLRHALARYRERGRFEPWLRRMVVRRAIDLRRGRSPEHELTDLAAASDVASDAVDRTALRQALAALPDGLRDVFLLKEVEGYSHVEIGKLLDVRPGASAVRLHRAHKQLRRMLQ